MNKAKYRSIFVFSIVIISMFCILGVFSRPHVNDEFAFHEAVAKEGFIQAQISMYKNWAGRIFNTFLMDTFTSFPLEKVYPVMATINCVTYTLAVLSLIGTLMPALSLFSKISLSLLACAMTLTFTFSLSETFYWLPGMPYFWAETLIIFALSLAVKAFRGSRASFFLCMLVLFLNATNLEQACVFQGIVAFLAMIFFILRRDKRCSAIACAFWLVSVAGFLVMFFAPGTAVRMAAMNSDKQSLIRSILRGFIPAFSMGILNGLQFFAKPIIYAVIFFLPMIADKIPPADEKLSLRIRAWHIVSVMLMISIFMQYMIGVIGGGSLPKRGVSLSLWLMYFTWNVLWIFFYRGKLISSEGFRNFCRKWRWPILVVSVLISANFTECVSALRTAPEYATEYDKRVEMILAQREKGIMNLRVPRLKNKTKLIFADINPIATWGIAGMARYYGVENIYLIPDELSSDTEAIRELMLGNLQPFAKLAESGDVASMLLMGEYRNEKSARLFKGAANSDEAEKWYTMGARYGDPSCMQRLSRLLLRKNFLKAVYWLIKSHVVTTRL